jgi:ribosome-associated GTPase EngA
MLKKLGKPVTLAVNKIDSASREALVDEFHSLGFKDMFGVSAEHRLGLDDLLDHVTEDFPAMRKGEQEEAPAEAELPKIRVAIIGRPNVGKSTLLNALAGEERSIVSPVAGTTRDSVNETVVRDGVEYVFLDTAGIRRKGKTKLMAEKMSVVMARRSIRMAHVVLLIIDATEGVLGHDATVAGYAHEEGRAVILCVNKWDAVPNDNKRLFTEQIRDELKFLEYAPVTFLSAKNKLGVEQIFPLIKEAYESASKRVTTGELNRFLETFRFEPAIKVFYITQASLRPPTFILFTDRPDALHFSAERFLINRLRERFGFRGTPIVVKTRGHHAKRR